jgi:hypothetical protein
MVIVSLVRVDLRDEFEMADEAFALSPISARAVLPSEQDYDAISEAFMETARGRWFLGEYAKRNRNSDTRMVLDAVSRIEESLAAQKQPPPESGLNKALLSIRDAVEDARMTAAGTETAAHEENLAPVRKAARIIREISWRWREIGADARICDLLDSQVAAIEGACAQFSPTGPQERLGAAFDLITARIAQFEDSDTLAAQAKAVVASAPAPAAPTEAVTPAAEAGADAAAKTDGGRGINTPDEAAVTTVEPAVLITKDKPEAAPGKSGIADAAGEAVDIRRKVADENAEAADAYDEALLDMVAQEMGAPDFLDIDDGFDEIDSATTASPTAVVLVQAEPPPPPAKPATVQPSLGSTLLASGIVRRPNTPASDPLAPIRRMSQAEKIAFFS